MSIAAELIREAEARRPKPPLPPEKRKPCCQGHDERRRRCTRPPAIQGRICAECWRGMNRRNR